MKTVLILTTLMVSTVDLQKNSNNRFTALPYTSNGELNTPCRTPKDCKSFGYTCRDGRTCQCDTWYIPDPEMKKCVGGVNQKCTYDEHCIQGAYCMNQSVCQCKEDTPYASQDGLTCSSSSKIEKPIYIVLITVASVVSASFNCLL